MAFIVDISFPSKSKLLCMHFIGEKEGTENPLKCIRWCFWVVM